jgi:ATP-dependent Zn protease
MRKTAVQEKPIDTELECTAYHEAGHAVAALVQGREVSEVTIVPDAKGDTLGHLRQDSLPALVLDQCDPGAPEQRAGVEREILFCFAGPIAEEIFCGRKNHDGASGDMTCALRLASFLCGNVDETAAYFDRLLLQARDLVLSHWPAVKRVADELLDRRTLTGPQATEAYLAGINADMNAHA